MSGRYLSDVDIANAAAGMMTEVGARTTVNVLEGAGGAQLDRARELLEQIRLVQRLGVAVQRVCRGRDRHQRLELGLNVGRHRRHGKADGLGLVRGDNARAARYRDEAKCRGPGLYALASNIGHIHQLFAVTHQDRTMRAQDRVGDQRISGQRGGVRRRGMRADGAAPGLEDDHGLAGGPRGLQPFEQRSGGVDAFEICANHVDFVAFGHPADGLAHGDVRFVSGRNQHRCPKAAVARNPREMGAEGP